MGQLDRTIEAIKPLDPSLEPKLTYPRLDSRQPADAYEAVMDRIFEELGFGPDELSAAAGDRP